MQRRTVLAGASGLWLSAGCLSLGSDPRLGRIVVANFTTSPISVVVAVLKRGVVRKHDSVVYEETHDIESNDSDSIVVPSASITDELPDEPGQYVIEYGFAGGEMNSFAFSEHVGTDCGQIHLDVREEGRVELFVSNECDTLDYGTTE